MISTLYGSNLRDNQQHKINIIADGNVIPANAPSTPIGDNSMTV